MESLINYQEECGGPCKSEINFHIILIIGISSWINYCVTVLWPLIVVNETLKVPLQIFLFLVEALISLIYSLISDIKSRRSSMKYSFKVMFISGMLSLLLVLWSFFVDSNLIRFDLKFLSSNYLGKKDNGIVMSYDNILLYDDNLSILGKVNTEEYRGREETRSENIKFGDKYYIENNYMSYDSKLNEGSEEFVSTLLTLLLFTCLGVLRSSSISTYHTINILIYETEITSKDDLGNETNSSCWERLCFYNIWRFVGIFIVRAVFLTLMLICFGNRDINEDKKIADHSYILLVNIIALILLSLCGNYTISNKLNLFKNKIIYSNEIDYSGMSIHISHLLNFMFGKKDGLFIFLLIPWWVLHFIQTGNHFSQWVVLGDNLSNIEWWELYLLLFESAAMLLVSIGLSLCSTLLSPIIIQIYCFVLISVVSSGLTICTYTIHEIPISSFSDFISAFFLCHGIFHLCCVVPSITILFLTIDSVSPKIRSSFLSVTYILISTAPFLDTYLNNNIENIDITLKLLITTTLVVFGLFFTGLLMNRYLTEGGFNGNDSTHSLELLSVYKEVVEAEKDSSNNNEYRFYTF